MTSRTLTVAGPGGPIASALAADLAARDWRVDTISWDDLFVDPRAPDTGGESGVMAVLLGPVEAMPVGWERDGFAFARTRHIPLILFGASAEALERFVDSDVVLMVLLSPWPAGGAALAVEAAVARQRRDARDREALTENLALVQAVLHESPLAIYAKDPHMRFVLSNRRHTALIGRPAAEILGRTDAELFGDDGGVMDSAGRTAFQTGQAQSLEFELALQGQAHVFQETVYPIRVEGERRVGVAGIASDLTEVRRQQAQLAERVEELDRSRRVSALTSECVELVQRCVSLDETLALTSGFFARMDPDANFSVYESLENQPEFVLRTHERRFGQAAPRESLDAQDCWALRTRRVYAVGPGSARIACRHVTAADTVTACVPLVSADRLIGLVTLERPLRATASEAERTARWIAQLETTAQSLAGALSTVSLRESLQQLALVDETTGLPNPRAFAASARKSLARARRMHETLVIAMFEGAPSHARKGGWGQDERARISRDIAELALGFFRLDDVVARLGNETFGVALAMKSVADAERRLEAFVDEMRRVCSARHWSVTPSLGFCAVAPDGGTTFEEAMQGAEDALREARRRTDAVVVRREPNALPGALRA